MGFSRQAYYRVAAENSGVSDHVIRLASSELSKARRRCPSKGCRSMYDDFGHHLPIGRDKSIELFMDMGYRVRYPKRYGRATQSGTREFPNLLLEKNVNGLNQVWQADMAHYLYGNTKLYTIYITDVYSQEVVGYGKLIWHITSMGTPPFTSRMCTVRKSLVMELIRLIWRSTMQR